MKFEEFEEKVRPIYNLDQAYKLYLDVRISILREFVKRQFEIADETWEEMEDGIFKTVIEESLKHLKKSES